MSLQEMRDLPDNWRKSSYSGPNNDCIEVANNHAAALVRDSKNRHDGTLEFSSDAFRAMLGWSLS